MQDDPRPVGAFIVIISRNSTGERVNPARTAGSAAVGRFVGLVEQQGSQLHHGFLARFASWVSLPT